MIVWRDGEPVTLTRFGPGDDEEEIIDLDYHGPKWARESPYGIIICSIWPFIELLRIPAKATQHLGSFRSVSLMNDGRHLAVERAEDATIAIIDLADGSQLAETWSHVEPLGIIGNYDGYVYANPCASCTSRPGTWRWKPGQEAKPLAHHISRIDAISGTYLVRQRSHTEIIIQTGRTFTAEPKTDFKISPGGRSIYATQGNEHLPYGHGQFPYISFIDLNHHGTPINHGVPPNSDIHHVIWEDSQHLLIPATSSPSDDVSQPVHVYRMNIKTGRSSLVSGCGTGPQRPLLIDPFITSESLRRDPT
jgi:hypothetical protein